MSGTPLTILRTFLNAIDAEMARSALESAGIAATIRSDDCGGMRPHMQIGGVDLLVRTEDAAEASALLDADQSSADPADVDQSDADRSDADPPVE